MLGSGRKAQDNACEIWIDNVGLMMAGVEYRINNCKNSICKTDLERGFRITWVRFEGNARPGRSKISR